MIVVGEVDAGLGAAVGHALRHKLRPCVAGAIVGGPRRAFGVIGALPASGSFCRAYEPILVLRVAMTGATCMSLARSCCARHARRVLSPTDCRATLGTSSKARASSSGMGGIFGLCVRSAGLDAGA